VLDDINLPADCQKYYYFKIYSNYRIYSGLHESIWAL
jgi:hypothetical protein